MSDYALSNLSGIVDAVGLVMGVPGEIGDEAAAGRGAAPRVVWEDIGAKYEPIVRQPKDGKAFALRVQSCTVRVRGAGYTAAEALRERFENALITLFSADGYAVKLVSSKPSGDRVTSADFTHSVTIELRIPCMRFLYTHATLPLTGQASGTVTADGTNSEDIPS